VPPKPHQLFATPKEKADLETRNGLLQFDEITRMIEDSASGFTFTPEILLRLHFVAIHDIYTCAGSFRTRRVYIQRGGEIDDTFHQPPPAEDVKGLVNEMCAYVNANFGKSPVHLAAYVMWRHGWIHPFFGGNGRTSRASAYLVLCARLGYSLPGSPTVPEQIAESKLSRDGYYAALHAADAAWSEGKLDISMMESLVSHCLAAQLLSVHDKATSGS
jgi:Fic family protein